MKFLADENVSNDLLKTLRIRGYDVKDIKEEKKFGISDIKVLELANKEGRIIITHDKDFLNIPLRPATISKGIIILRFSNQNPQNVIDKFLPILQSKLHAKFENSISIISDGHVEFIRMAD